LAAGVLADAGSREGIDVRTVTLTRGENGYSEPNIPELGTVHRPNHLGYLLAPARAFSTMGGPALRAAASAQPDADVAVSVDPQLRILGWRTHASQHLERAYPLPGWLLFDFWDKEHYVVFDPVPSDRTL
jgi:hypothetical protein